MVMNDMMDDGKWGAEIAVDGKRPEWLKDETPISWKHQDFQGWFGADFRTTACRISCWEPKTCIRLPADHPHYQQTQTQPQTLTAQERLERLEALAGRIARLEGIKAPETPPLSWVDEARALVAEMEPVVDGDLVEARRIAAEKHDGGTKSLNGDAIRAGVRDSSFEVEVALAAIKRGRELARGDVKQGVSRQIFTRQEWTP